MNILNQSTIFSAYRNLDNLVIWVPIVTDIWTQLNYVRLAPLCHVIDNTLLGLIDICNITAVKQSVLGLCSWEHFRSLCCSHSILYCVTMSHFISTRVIALAYSTTTPVHKPKLKASDTCCLPLPQGVGDCSLQLTSTMLWYKQQDKLPFLTLVQALQ